MSEQSLTFDDPFSGAVSENLRRVDDLVQRGTYLLMMIRQRQERQLRGEVYGQDNIYRTSARSAEQQRDWDADIKPGDLVTDRERQKLGTVLSKDATVAVVRYGQEHPVSEPIDAIRVVHSGPGTTVQHEPAPQPTATQANLDQTSEPTTPIGVGDKVQALDRGNIGTVSEINADGTIGVHFENKATGAAAAVNFEANELAVLKRFDPKNEPRVKLGDTIDGPDGAGVVIDTNGNNVIVELADGSEIEYSAAQLDGFVADTSDNMERTAFAASSNDTSIKAKGSLRPEAAKPDPQRLAKHQRKPDPSGPAQGQPSPTRPTNWDKGPKRPKA